MPKNETIKSKNTINSICVGSSAAPPRGRGSAASASGWSGCSDCSHSWTNCSSSEGGNASSMSNEDMDSDMDGFQAGGAAEKRRATPNKP